MGLFKSKETRKKNKQERKEKRKEKKSKRKEKRKEKKSKRKEKRKEKKSKRKEKRKEKKSKRKEKRKEKKSKRKEKWAKLKLKAIAPLMRVLVKRKKVEPASDVFVLAGQVRDLYSKKKHYEKLYQSYSLSGNKVSHLDDDQKKGLQSTAATGISAAATSSGVPISPDMVNSIIELVKSLFKKKEKDGTTGDPELDQALDESKDELKEAENKEKEEEKESSEKSGFNVMWIFGGLAGVIVLFLIIKATNK